MKISINKAKRTLLGNRKRGYTLPTNNKLYPAQWNWDSAFIALGYSYFNLKGMRIDFLIPFFFGLKLFLFDLIVY